MDDGELELESMLAAIESGWGLASPDARIPPRAKEDVERLTGVSGIIFIPPIPCWRAAALAITSAASAPRKSKADAPAVIVGPPPRVIPLLSVPLPPTDNREGQPLDPLGPSHDGVTNSSKLISSSSSSASSSEGTEDVFSRLSVPPDVRRGSGGSSIGPALIRLEDEFDNPPLRALGESVNVVSLKAIPESLGLNFLLREDFAWKAASSGLASSNGWVSSFRREAGADRLSTESDLTLDAVRKEEELEVGRWDREVDWGSKDTLALRRLLVELALTPPALTDL